MNCDHCNKELPRGLRHKIPNAPKLARFCLECWRDWLAGFWQLNSIYKFENGGWRKPQ